MKKILLIVLAIALVLSLCAGCNTNKRIDDDVDDDPEPVVTSDTPDDNSGDKPDDNTDDNSNVDDDKSRGDTPDGWPAELPPYPDGEITRLEQKEYDGYGITIINTSIETMEEYAATMISAGWECTRNNNGELGVAMILSKDIQNISLLLLKDGTTLSLNLYRTLEKEDLPNVWPVDYLPQGFPEYPDGDITSVKVDESGSIFISIEESSQKTFDKYVTTLEDAGWEFEGLGDETLMVWFIEKDGENGTIAFYAPDGSVDITVY